jgi:phosphoribosylamine---glycine ligase
MNFLLISECGDGTGLALRLKEEGHDCRVWIPDPKTSNRCKGLIDYAEAWGAYQVVVADCTGSGPLLDRMKENEIPTVGGSSFADKLEGDRQFAEEVLRDCGIKTPESERLADWDDASKVIEKMARSSGRVVIKPEGDLSGVVPSYVADDVEDANRTIERYKQLAGSAGVELTIQQYIEGVAVSTEGWFNGDEWIEGMFNHTIERKQFLNDDLGPSAGCTGNVVWRCEADDPLVVALLEPLTKLLKEKQYRGAIDVNAVVNEEDCYALEFTPRFGYDAFPTLLYTLCHFDFGSFLDSLSRSQSLGYELEGGFGAGVRISIPPWPSEKFEAQGGAVLEGLVEDWFYPYDVRLNDKKEIETTGGYGIIGVMNGSGETIDAAFANAYRRCKKLRLPSKQYRTDLAETCMKDYRALRKVVELASVS